MTINYAKLKEQAERSGISIFILVKRKIGYGKNINRGMCKNCEYVCLPKFHGIERLQCIIIGVGDDFYANVKPTWCCKKGYKLNPEQSKVLVDFLKDYKE